MRGALGLDGGGSSLRALGRDEEGREVFRGKSGAANWAQTPREELVSHLKESLLGCPAPSAICACLAGILTPADRQECGALISEISGCPEVVVHADYTAGLAACPPNVRALVIAGTGSLVCSWQGREAVRTSGGGPLLGDEGSVYSISRGLLAKMVRSPKDWDEEAWQRVYEAFESQTPSETTANFYRFSDRAERACRLINEVRRLQPISRVVSSLAEQQLRGLAEILRTHLDAFPSDHEGPIYLMGGLWSAVPSAFDTFQSAALASMAPDSSQSPSFCVLEREPVEGAVKMALDFLKRPSSLEQR